MLAQEAESGLYAFLYPCHPPHEVILIYRENSDRHREKRMSELRTLAVQALRSFIQIELVIGCHCVADHSTQSRWVSRSYSFTV